MENDFWPTLMIDKFDRKKKDVTIELILLAIAPAFKGQGEGSK